MGVFFVKNIELQVKEFENALLQINRIKAAEIFEKCFLEDSSFDVLEILVISTLEKIGFGWEDGSTSLSQVYMSGIICEELIDNYMPKMSEKRKEIPKMAIAVLMDHHALGKRIVYSVVRASGFELMDFGHGLSVEDLVMKTLENNIEILLISTLMLPSALKVKLVKEKLIEKGANTKIIAGGAPFRFDRNLWKAVGADADGKNASDITRTIDTLLKGGNK